MVSTKWTYHKEPWKKGVSPVITLFFWKFCYSLRTSSKRWFDVPTTEMSIFLLFVSARVLFVSAFHSVKRVRIRSYSGPHFPAFGLNTERYAVSLRIQSKCGKMQTRITPKKDALYVVFFLWVSLIMNKFIMSSIIIVYYLVAVQSSWSENTQKI